MAQSSRGNGVDQDVKRNTGKAAVSAKTVSPVKGGWVKRDARTGQLHEVQSESGTYRASSQTEAAVKAASKNRSDALQRLANR